MKRVVMLVCLVISSASFADGTTFYSNGVTAIQQGNTTFYSNGVTAMQQGNTMYYSNGVTASRY